MQVYRKKDEAQVYQEVLFLGSMAFVFTDMPMTHNSTSQRVLMTKSQ